MQTTPILSAAVIAWLLLTVAVLRVMARARRADELADEQWEELARLHSASGVAFFPTAHARVELERAMAEAVELERPRARERVTRAPVLTRLHLA